MEWNVSMGGRPLEEIELVDRAKRGDVGAYEELVRTHQSLAVRTAYVITGQAADAQDAVQEAFVKAYRSLGRFREGAAFRPWLLRIVANEAISRRRAAHRHVNLALEQERHREVVAAMSMLRPEDRLVIAYRYWFELSEAEMAEALGCPRGTVKSRLSRALSKLRETLVAAGAGPEGERVVLDA